MKEKKIAPLSHEAYEEKKTLKAKKHFYIILILNILLALPTIFSPNYFTKGLITVAISVVLSSFMLIGVKYTNVFWVILAFAQLIYYFFNLGIYLSPGYSMLWFLLICARSGFCFYSLWGLLINYDVQEIIRERQRKSNTLKK